MNDRPVNWYYKYSSESYRTFQCRFDREQHGNMPDKHKIKHTICLSFYSENAPSCWTGEFADIKYICQFEFSVLQQHTASNRSRLLQENPSVCVMFTKRMFWTNNCNFKRFCSCVGFDNSKQTQVDGCRNRPRCLKHRQDVAPSKSIVWVRKCVIIHSRYNINVLCCLVWGLLYYMLIMHFNAS